MYLFVCCPSFLFMSIVSFCFCAASITAVVPPQNLYSPPARPPACLAPTMYPSCVLCYKVIIAGDPNAADTQALISAAQRSFCPNLVLIVEDTSAQLNKKQEAVKEDGEEEPLFREVLEAYGGGYGAGEDGKASAYVCFDNSCSRPVRTAEALRGVLG